MPAPHAPSTNPSFMRSLLAILWKDLALEWRSRELLSGMLLFALLVILIFNFALDLQAGPLADVTAGVLWVTLVFAGSLSLNRSLAAEKERGCLDGLLLAPLDRSALYFGKALANLVFMLLVALALLPVYGLLYAQNLFQPGLLLVILLGCLGYAAAGTLLGGLALQSRTRDLLLPVLLFPVTIPLLLSAVKASAGFLAGLPLADIQPWLNLLLVCDLVFSAAGWMLFDFVLEE
jgi:heme exporter protein B